MAEPTHGLGGLKYDPTKKARPPELNVFIAFIAIVVAFELLGRLIIGESFLFNTREGVDGLFNTQRLSIIILQVSTVGIIALGVTQVIITGGIDLSSGSVVGAASMVAMSFAQTLLVNGNPNPKAIFGEWAMDLPVLVPIIIGLGVGFAAGLINGLLIAYTKIPPFIATLGMMVSARGFARWWSTGNPISFPTESYNAIGSGMNPVFIFVALAILCHLVMTYTKYGKYTYAVGSNEQATRMSGINVDRHKVLVYVIAAMLAAVAAIVVSSKGQTAQANMGVMYELQAITMAVIGGVSLTGGRGSILGTVIGSLILGVIISGFTFLKLDAYYQDMTMGAIIVGAVVLDQWRQKQGARA